MPDRCFSVYCHKTIEIEKRWYWRWLYLIGNKNVAQSYDHENLFGQSLQGFKVFVWHSNESLTVLFTVSSLWINSHVKLIFTLEITRNGEVPRNITVQLYTVNAYQILYFLKLIMTHIPKDYNWVLYFNLSLESIHSKNVISSDPIPLEQEDS